MCISPHLPGCVAPTARFVTGHLTRGLTGGSVAPDDGLARWIRDLRGHLGRGDLAGIRPIELGYGTQHLAGETTIRVMLNDLDDLNDPAGSAAADPVWRQERLCALRDDFRRLRELLG